MKKIIFLVILIIFSLITLYYYKPVTIDYLFEITRTLKQEKGYQVDINWISTTKGMTIVSLKVPRVLIKSENTIF